VELGASAGLIVATIGGAAIGLEREWSGHATGPQARFGGIRTFTLLGGLSGVAGWFSMNGLLPLAVVVLGASAALVIVGYAAASRTSVDATTEVAAIVVLAAGTLAGAGHLAFGSALVAGTALLLLEKTRVHAVVERVDDQALRASVRFAAMACVILPLLPPGPYGPFDAVRPRELWALVLFFSGLSFVGWIARRMMGPHQGVIVSGLIGGIISSTSATLACARDSRAPEAPRVALAAGAVGACTVMLVRVMVACAALNPALALTLPRYVALPFVIGLATIVATWRANGPEAASAPADSPLRVRAALQMTALFQLVLVLIFAVRAQWSGALMATSALVALTDLDALTLSLARSAPSPTDIPPATAALVVGMLSNTLMKLAIAVAVGRGSFRVVTAGALGASALTMIAVLLLG